MSRLGRRLAEDKALRDTARRLFKADLALVREDLQLRGVGGRLADRLSDGAMEIVLDAVDYAEANKGKVATGMAALAVVFAGGPLMRMLSEFLDDDDGAEPEQSEDDDRSDEA